MDMIKINGVTKRYGRFTAVKNLDLSIEKGRITGFVGRNGAGKTTVMRMMMNILSPTEGTIKIDGLDSVKDSRRIREFTGYMPGDSSFHEGITCMDAFRLCCRISGISQKRALDYAEYFELDIHKRISELSLGNRKKVSIIQSLLKDGRLLILDEPTNGLDPLMQKKFYDLISALKEKGVTVFLSSHNLSEIEKCCDRVIFIKDGQIIEDIDMEEVRKDRKKKVRLLLAGGEEKTFITDVPAGELLSQLAGMNVEDVEITDISIEERFIGCYMEEGERNDR